MFEEYSQIGNNDCGPDKDTGRVGNRNGSLVCPSLENVTADPYQEINLGCYPAALSAEAKFGYTLFFLLVPWPFFIYEFFTSR